MYKTKKRYLPIAALIILGLIGSSWAFWTQVLEVANEYMTGTYKTTLEEDFVSPDGWQPGMETNKDVTVKNQGTVPVFVKAVINQQWIRRENVLDSEGNIISPAKGEPFGLSFQASGEQEYAALINWGKQVVLLSQGASDDDMLRLGIPTVDTLEEAEGKWLLLNEKPDANMDYTFYYIGRLNAGEETPLLVDGVTMNPAIKAAILEKKYFYDQETGVQEVVSVLNDTYDYQNAQYTMDITVHTVQATKAALENEFTVAVAGEELVTSQLTSYAVGGTKATEENKLYFQEEDGVLTYATDSSKEDDLFMSFVNMLPGESYNESLIIENNSNKTFDLYMQIIPLEQTEIMDELLELISMDVYLDGELLYRGTAMGKEYAAGTNNLQDVILLGNYANGTESQIDVKLTLSKDTGMEYCDLLTKIDWRFMVTETNVNESDLVEISISKVNNMGVELSGATLSIYETDAEGNATIIAKDQDGNELTWVTTGEPMDITGMTAGSYILHEETAPRGYKVADDIMFTVNDDKTVTKDSETGDIDGNTIIMTDLRTTEVLPAGTTLLIEKTVSGTAGDKNQEFTFTLILKDEAGEEVTESFSYDGSKAGTIASGESVQLKHSEYIGIYDIPEGVQYKVVESDNKGYTVTEENTSGTIDGVGQTAKFTNHKDASDDDDGDGGKTPQVKGSTNSTVNGKTYSPQSSTRLKSVKTGDMTNWLVWSILCLGCVCLAGGWLRLKKRKQ